MSAPKGRWFDRTVISTLRAELRISAGFECEPQPSLRGKQLCAGDAIKAASKNRQRLARANQQLNGMLSIRVDFHAVDATSADKMTVDHFHYVAIKSLSFILKNACFGKEDDLPSSKDSFC